MSGPTLQAKQRVVSQLNNILSKDTRFVYRAYVSSGMYGTAHRIQFTNPRTGQVIEYLIKVSFNDIDSRQQLIYEKDVLAQLRGGMHVVRTVNATSIPREPLALHAFPYEWVGLEWLPNGTIENFIVKARAHGIRRLPNRLLWRLFLCLVRGCCALAWPRGRTNNGIEIELPVPGVPPGPLAHFDLHLNNGVFGNFDVGDEHGISPVLTLIDFGLAQEQDEIDDARLDSDNSNPSVDSPRPPPQNLRQNLYQNQSSRRPSLRRGAELSVPPYPPVQFRGIISNIRGVAEMMIHLIVLDERIDPIVYDKPANAGNNQHYVSIPRSLNFIHQGTKMTTEATRLFPESRGAPYPFPWLDPQLREIVAMCCASEDNLWNVPALRDLSQWLREAASTRGASYYNDQNETDVSIRALCMHILHNPPPRSRVWD